LKPQDGVSEGNTVVVLQAEDRLFGLVVDQVLDTEEIVVKPLGAVLSRIPVYAGATIMGDGRAALILDVLGLAQASAVVRTGGEAAVAVAESVGEAVTGEVRSVLLVRVGQDRAAIPVTPAVRLERFARSDVEWSGNRPIVQYRGSVLPLRSTAVDVPVEELLQRDTQAVNVVVHTEDGHSVGFLVDELLDIVEERFVVEARVGAGEGVSGTAVIQDKVARVLDLSKAVAEEAR
jgi:two-component system chemotaxis sensor kinase CheA